MVHIAMKKFYPRLRIWLLTDLIISIFCIVYYLTLYFLDGTCFIKLIFNIECPTCGVTRALVCFLNADIEGYIEYNFLAIPFLLVLYGCLHFTNRLKQAFNFLAIIIAVALMIRYILLHF